MSFFEEILFLKFDASSFSLLVVSIVRFDVLCFFSFEHLVEEKSMDVVELVIKEEVAKEEDVVRFK